MPADLEIQAQLAGPATVVIRWLGDRRVVWVEFDAGEDGAVLSSTTSSIFEAAAVTALEQRLPLVLVLSTMGADIEEGLPALHGWGRLAAALAKCSGCVPTIAVVDGPAVSGPALLLGLADLTVMTPSSYAFVNGPVMVEQFTGVRISIEELGGSGNLARHAGIPSAIVEDRAAAVAMVEELLTYLPDHVDQEPPRWPNDDPADRPCPEAGELIPGIVDGELRRPQGGGGDRRPRLAARAAFEMGDQHRHRVRHRRRPPGRHRRQPADVARRHDRHPGIAEGGPVRGVLRRVQRAAHHVRRHALASTPARTSNGEG